MKRVCIHQPDFLPYLGFFHRLLLCDEFILLDNAQFEKGGWHHRDKIKTPNGPKWLTLALRKEVFPININHVRLGLDREDWIGKNLNMIEANYRKAAHFERYFPEIRRIYEAGHETLLDINLAFLRFMFEVLEIDIPVRLASDIPVPGASNERLVNLLRAVGADRYLSGVGARGYMRESLYQEAGIAVDWQEFTHPVYPQLHGPFEPYLSCLDLVFNTGPAAKEVLRSCLEK